MDKLRELERVLTDIEYLADTFCAIDIANQNEMLELPCCALTVPSETLKTYAVKARELHSLILRETN